MSPSAPLKFAVALFEGFQALDVFGPLDMLNQVSKTEAIEFVVLGHTLNPISTLNKVPGVPTPPTIGQSVVPTHTFDDAPDDIEVLLVPGGIGARDLEHSQKVVDFIRGRYPKLKYLLTVCTGSALAARAGVLDGREATSNKKSFKWVGLQLPLLPH
jgi:putative intracellular protease/amidase